MRSLSTKRVKTLLAGALVLGFGAALLGGCEAKPGVAAAGKGWVITEEHLSNVSAELAAVVDVNRGSVLRDLISLEEGARDALKGCPSWDSLPIADLQMPDNVVMHRDAKDIVDMNLCLNLTNPEIAHNAKMSPVDKEVGDKLMAAMQKAANDPHVVYSPRSEKAIRLAAQQNQQFAN